MHESSRYAWWLLILLFSLIIALNFALFGWMLSQPPKSVNRSLEEAEISLKLAFALGSDPASNPLLNQALEELESPVWEQQVRKAIVQAYLGKKGYAETLQRAAQLPAERLTPAERRWYTTLWAWALTGTHAPERISGILEALSPTVSPFYLRLAEAVMAQRAGEKAKAEQLRDSLRRRGVLGVAVLFAILIAVCFGVVIGLGVLLWVLVNPPRLPARPLENASPFALDPLLWALIIFLLTVILSPAEFLARFLEGFGVPLPETTLLNQLIATALSLSYLHTVQERLETEVRWFAPNGFWKYALAVLTGGLAYVPIAVGGLVLVVLLGPALSQLSHPFQEMAQGAENWLHWVVIFVQGVVLAPIVEEFVFRGVLFQTLWQRTGRVWLSAFVSGFLFAVIHPQFLAGLIPLTAIGTVLALLFAYTRSLVPSILLHAVNNLVAMLALWSIAS
ncbi:MAG: CPBP family intramembrane metalloprotease [Armatimonadetes bacterium]|nr:CPBP family intramembrane metalloprotease [Armatimonadota bacterium]